MFLSPEGFMTVIYSELKKVLHICSYFFVTIFWQLCPKDTQLGSDSDDFKVYNSSNLLKIQQDRSLYHLSPCLEQFNGATCVKKASCLEQMPPIDQGRSGGRHDLHTYSVIKCPNLIYFALQKKTKVVFTLWISILISWMYWLAHGFIALKYTIVAFLMMYNSQYQGIFYVCFAYRHWLGIGYLADYFQTWRRP